MSREKERKQGACESTLHQSRLAICCPPRREILATATEILPKRRGTARNKILPANSRLLFIQVSIDRRHSTTITTATTLYDDYARTSIAGVTLQPWRDDNGTISRREESAHRKTLPQYDTDGVDDPTRGGNWQLVLAEVLRPMGDYVQL